MVWRWSWDGTNWEAPAQLPFQGDIPAEGVCAATSGPGRVEVFAAEANTQSPVWWRGNGASWTAGPPLLGDANLPAEPLAAVCSSPQDIDVFAAGAGNTPWWWHWNGRRWTVPETLPDAGSGIPAEPIAAVSPAPGRLDVFAAGAGNHLWHWWKVGAAGWRVEDLGGNLPAVGVSAVSWGRNRIDVFAAGAGNLLWHWWSNGGSAAGSFAGPENLGGSLVAGTVSAVSHAVDRLDVFGIAGNKRLAHWRWDGRQWWGPAYQGGRWPGGDDIPAGDVSAVVRKRHRLDVFVASGGNTLRQWPGGGLENATTHPWKNWPLNHDRAPTVPEHLWPDSLDELVNIVREAGQLGRGVRAVGTSWSNSDVAVSPAYIVETERLNKVLTDVLETSLNARGSTLGLVHVEAGRKLWELNNLLDRRGQALKTMGGSSGQSLAGVVSTSARGMDVDRGPIPDMVRAIHLVGPGGVQHWIEPSDAITTREGLKQVLDLPDENIHYDDDWFNAVLVSVGSLGIIYSLIVEVVPQYDLVETREALDWSTMKARLTGGSPSPFAGNRGVEVVVDPYQLADGSPRTAYLTTRTEAAPTGARTPPNDFFRAFVASNVWIQVHVSRQNARSMVPPLIMLSQPIPAPPQGWGHTVMGRRDPGPARARTVGFAFDATMTGYLDFVDSVFQLLDDALNESPPRAYLGYVSIRFQGAGRSPAYLNPHRASARTCLVECAAVWSMDGIDSWPDTPILLARIEAEGRKFGGIQHWGMNEGLNRIDVERGYPRLDAWRRVRWELTKGGTIATFDSDFTRRCGLSAPPYLVALADYDRDGRTDLAVWRPSTGTWLVWNSSNLAQRSQRWGSPGDVPVPGDYDGDRRADLAVWRPSTGVWQIALASGGKRTRKLGQAGDVPVPGDYDGDGTTDLAVWRPSDRVWYLIESRKGRSRKKKLGEAGDIPVPADYDGDGKTDLAVWRPTDGTWHAVESSTGRERTQQLGQPGDIPVPGDYDGDGKTDLAVWRPTVGTWHVVESSTGRERSQRLGQAGDIPVPGDYDGDGSTERAVWSPSAGLWWIEGVPRGQPWGQFGDIPV
jgi:FAD binding domain/FG-GAP-like repeat